MICVDYIVYNNKWFKLWVNVGQFINLSVSNIGINFFYMCYMDVLLMNVEVVNELEGFIVIVQELFC